MEHLQQIKNLRLMHLMSYVVPMKKFQKSTMFKLTFFDKVWLPNYNKNCSIKVLTYYDLKHLCLNSSSNCNMNSTFYFAGQNPCPVLGNLLQERFRSPGRVLEKKNEG